MLHHISKGPSPGSYRTLTSVTNEISGRLLLVVTISLLLRLLKILLVFGINDLLLKHLKCHLLLLIEKLLLLLKLIHILLLLLLLQSLMILILLQCSLLRPQLLHQDLSEFTLLLLLYLKDSLAVFISVHVVYGYLWLQVHLFLLLGFHAGAFKA